MSEQISVHRVKGKFYGFKRMIGGKRFYFGRDLGILNDCDTDRKKAHIAANVYAQVWNKLKAENKSWTPGDCDRADAMAKIVLGLHQPPEFAAQDQKAAENHLMTVFAHAHTPSAVSTPITG